MQADFGMHQKCKETHLEAINPFHGEHLAGTQCNMCHRYCHATSAAAAIASLDAAAIAAVTGVQIPHQSLCVVDLNMEICGCGDTWWSLCGLCNSYGMC